MIKSTRKAIIIDEIVFYFWALVTPLVILYASGMWIMGFITERVCK